MERRKAITTAAAASLTLLAGAAGIALNSGLVGADGDDNVGQISPVDATAIPPVTVYVLDPAAVTPAPTVQPTTSRPLTTSAASAYQDDDPHEDESDDDDHYEDESDDDDHYEDDDDRHEYDGAEDDD